MDQFIGVEQARGTLGRLAEEVSAGSEAVVITKRGQALAVLVSRDEYSRLKEAASRLARADLQQRLAQVRREIKRAGIPPEAVDEAIAAARQLA
jgi:prevent-host-death family protein